MRVIAFTEIWEMYGGLAAYEDVASSEAMGSQIIVLTGPKAAFLAKGGN